MKHKTTQEKYPFLEQQLRDLRIPISELASILGLSRQTVYKKMAGDMSWSTDQLITIQNLLRERTKRKITLNQLLSEDLPNGNK